MRLELTRREPKDDSDADRYARAARFFRDWLAEGVIMAETAPVLYAYEHDFVSGGASQTRRGVLAALRVEPWERRVVLPHERTLSGPKQDRLDLLRACRANFSPIWGLYAGAPDATTRLWVDAERREPDQEAVDRDGVRHRVWTIADASLTRRFHAALAESPVYIADGHHRYETARHYEAEVCSDGRCSDDAAAHFTLAYLVDIDDPGLVVLGTHRVIQSPRPLDAAETRRVLEESFSLVPVSGGPAALLAALADEPRPAFAVWAPELDLAAVAGLRTSEVPAEAAPGRSAAWRRLDLAALHTLVIDRLYPDGTTRLSEGGWLSYTRDLAEAERTVTSGEADIAFFVRHTSVRQVTAVADAGDLMPEKSTYFFPKPVTGLAIANLADEISPGV